MDSRAQATQQLRETLKEWFEQIRFAQAAELARAGRYLEAENLLAPFLREPSALKELDLLARISAQRRQYGRARHLWENALRQEPENANYKRAIQCTLKAERFDAIVLRVTTVGLAIIISILLSLWVYHHLHKISSARIEDKSPNVHGSLSN